MKTDNTEFTGFLQSRIKASGLNRRQIIQKAGLDLSYGYKILSGRRRTREKDYVAALCIALHLSAEETQKALELNHQPKLDPESRRDALILDALKRHLTIEDTNDLLESSGCRYLRTGRE